ncbi:MAG: DNA polymerase I [Planctomycetota bacterium]|nr:DNA polymerase I [Planctomycetota bacterium]MDA1106050.1 DNA polymerase I [Planctomycetota bacterium]
MAETLYIIDGHAQFFRAYYAIRGGLTSRITGEPTAMVYGFASMLAKLYRECRPEHLVLVIDAAGDDQTFRSDLYPEYKANRDPAPEDFHPQVVRCLELARLLSIPIYAHERVEADDVIATLVRKTRAEHPGWSIRIASKDKDLGQLLDERVSLYDVQTAVELDAEALFDSKGVRPEQVVDMLALMGDTVDNVPGIPGIGPKTAAQLITTYGSIEGVLENLAALTPKRREAIEKGRDTLALSRQLVRLKDDCAVEINPAAARADLAQANAPGVLELFRLLGFGGLRSQWTELLGVADVNSAEQSEPVRAQPPALPRREVPARSRNEDLPLFAMSASANDADSGGLASEAAAPPLGSYSLIATRAELDRFVASARESARNGGVLGVDTETTGVRPRVDALCGVCLSIAPGTGVYVPTRSPEPASHLRTEEVIEALRPLLEDASIPKALHNAKFDIQVLRAAGIALRGVTDDTMILDAIVHPEDRSHGLKECSEALLSVRMQPISTLIGSGQFQRRFDDVPLHSALPYAAADPDICLRVREHLHHELTDAREASLYRDVERPLVEVIAAMEYEGIALDREELARQRNRLGAMAVDLKDQVLQASPRSFNPDSPKQLAEVLFNGPSDFPPGLGLPIVKKTKTGVSTDSEVLESLVDDPTCDSTIPGLILQYRQVTKLVGTYLVALDEAVVPSTGRIHASFHQLGTATGRLSSSDPNLQNIPIRSEMGRDIRRAFTARAGNLLVCADYSQVELRILAHLSGDAGLVECFARGEDIHRAVAAEVFGVEPAAVTDAQRGVAKMVNFGIVYGITAHGLSRMLGSDVPLSRAKQIIDDYRARFSGIDRFLQSCVEEARQTGGVRTILGRRRPIPEVHSRNPNQRRLGERIAINTVVQGSAADLIKVAMLRVHERLALQHPRAQLLLQIHDELVLEAPEPEASEVARMLEATMAGAMTLSVPLVAEASIGRTWADC